MHRILIALSLAATTALPAGAQSADATLEKAVATYADMKSVRASFEQTIENPMTGTKVTAKGEIQQRKPNLLSVRFTDPAGDRIVVDGSSVWVYLPSTNPGQVIKQAASAGSAAMLDPASELLRAPRTRYTITDGGTARLGSRTTRVLTLVPKTEMGFAKATVWIDPSDGTLRQFEVVDANGLSRRVHLTNIRMNAATDPAAFRFTPPAGTKVFEQPGAR